jgi:hypothetical protein
LPVRCAFQIVESCATNAWNKKGTWPLPQSRKAVAEEFHAVAEGVPDKE